MNYPQMVSAMHAIKLICAEFNGLTLDQMDARTRNGEIVRSRQEAHYLTLKYTTLSLSYIGSFIGGKDHATVLHSKRTISNLLDTDPKFREEFEQLERIVISHISKYQGEKMEFKDASVLRKRIESIMQIRGYSGILIALSQLHSEL